MNCNDFQEQLPDLILTPNARPSLAAAAHLQQCPPCAEEYLSFQQTFAVLDSWKAPEPTPYFNQKMQVRLREEIAAPKMGWFESLVTRLQLNTGHQFRPAMAGVMALVLVVGGGSFAGLNRLHSSAQPAAASATVNDLEILDRNEQAFQALDQLQIDEDSSPDDSGTSAPPAS